MEQIFIHLQKIVHGMDNLVSNLRAVNCVKVNEILNNDFCA